jgi:hypothetical protein
MREEHWYYILHGSAAAQHQCCADLTPNMNVTLSQVVYVHARIVRLHCLGLSRGMCMI